MLKSLFSQRLSASDHCFGCSKSQHSLGVPPSLRCSPYASIISLWSLTSCVLPSGPMFFQCSMSHYLILRVCILRQDGNRQLFTLWTRAPICNSTVSHLEQGWNTHSQLELQTVLPHNPDHKATHTYTRDRRRCVGLGAHQLACGAFQRQMQRAWEEERFHDGIEQMYTLLFTYLLRLTITEQPISVSRAFLPSTSRHFL